MPLTNQRNGGILLSLAKTLCSLLALSQYVSARKTSGSFRLSGVNTEHVLSSFAVSRSGGRVTLQIGMDTMYDNETHLKFRVYKDDDWKKFQKATLCTERIKLAVKTVDAKLFTRKEGQIESNRNIDIGKWQFKHTLMVAEEDTEEAIDSPHYYYFVMDDCSLEKYLHDDAIPTIRFEIDTWNFYKTFRGRKRTTHMGADEDWLMPVHEITFLVSIALLIWLGLVILTRFVRKKAHNTVHASLLWITIATVLDMCSSIFQLVHLDAYHFNGIGMYACDALSTHLSSMCDALIMLFLLSIGAGWTMPYDVVTVNRPEGAVQSMMADMASPLGALLKLSKTGQAGVGFLVFNAILAQWGRTYNDDFECYHEFSHLPGHILIFTRIVLGFAFLGTTHQTRLHCRISQLGSFYTVLAVIGFIWFEALPLVTSTSNWFLPFHLRHPFVYFASAILQTTSLVLLSWLVTSHSSSYHQYSHMSNNEKATMAETLSTPTAGTTREFKFFGKAKVRLD